MSISLIEYIFLLQGVSSELEYQFTLGELLEMACRRYKGNPHYK